MTCLSEQAPGGRSLIVEEARLTNHGRYNVEFDAVMLQLVVDGPMEASRSAITIVHRRTFVPPCISNNKEIQESRTARLP